ncbi:MAG: hypothetical protein Q8O83_00305 [bacterium]|nr:hypothetical protein [bacterium]
MKAQIDKIDGAIRILLKAETPQDVEDLIDIKERSEELGSFLFSYEVGDELALISENYVLSKEDFWEDVANAEEGMMVALELCRTSPTPEIIEVFKKMASEKDK